MGLLVFLIRFSSLSLSLSSFLALHPSPSSIILTTHHHPLHSIHSHSFALFSHCPLITSFSSFTLINCHQLRNELNITPYPEDNRISSSNMSYSMRRKNLGTFSFGHSCCGERRLYPFNGFSKHISAPDWRRATTFFYSFTHAKKKQ